MKDDDGMMLRIMMLRIMMLMIMMMRIMMIRIMMLRMMRWYLRMRRRKRVSIFVGIFGQRKNE